MGVGVHKGMVIVESARMLVCIVSITGKDWNIDLHSGCSAGLISNSVHFKHGAARLSEKRNIGF